MLKKSILLLMLLVVLSSCKNSTETMDSPLVGTWNLTTMKVNGNTVAKADYTGVPVKILFSFTGNGTIWTEDYGKASGTTDFIWSTSGSTLNMQLPGEVLKSYGYSISNSQLTITLTNGYQFIFTLQQ